MSKGEMEIDRFNPEQISEVFLSFCFLMCRMKVLDHQTKSNDPFSHWEFIHNHFLTIMIPTLTQNEKVYTCVSSCSISLNFY